MLLVAFLMAIGMEIAAADTTLARGMVRDSVTTVGIPYASIRCIGASAQVVADANGLFEIAIPAGVKFLRVASQGYATRDIPVGTNSLNLYDINLSPRSEQLREIVVKKERYSKRNNPAVDLATRLRRSASDSDPRRNPYYSYDAYRRTTIGVADFNTDTASALIRRFPFLIEHTDTSEIDGRPVLNLAVEEKATTHLDRRDPSAHREIVRGRRSSGVGQMMDLQNAQTVLDDVLRDVDLYDSNIHLMRNSFVSPLSAIAPDFYRFYIVDTTMVAGHRCIVLAFYPRNKSTLGFVGHIYAEPSDSTMFIRRVDMKVDPEINLNFVRSMKLSQEYEKAPDGSRWKVADDITLDAEAVSGTPPVYITRKIRYSNHSYDTPTDSAVFAVLGNTIEEPDADSRDDAFWQRTVSLAHRASEANLDGLRERLHRVPLFYWGEKALRILFTGYVSTGSHSRFDFGPVNTMASYNSLEGLRLRAGGLTTANLSKHWFGRGYVAYGVRDHRWKYSVEAEYSFNEKKYHSREFPIHSLRLTHSYDVDHLGTHYLFTNNDNFVLSLHRMPNHNDTYRRLTRLEYTLELGNNLSICLSADNTRQETSRFVSFTQYDGTDISHYSLTTLGVLLRFAPGERFVQTKSQRIPVNEDAPTLTLEHRYAPAGIGGAIYTVNKTEVNFSKRFWLSLMGSVDINVGGGCVWSSAPYPELLIPNANISYTIQPRSFALMNPMEFVNSSYLSWDLSYRARGALLNCIPLIRRAGLREVVGVRGILGHLSRRCMPGRDNPSLLRFPEGSARAMGSTPYIEASAGLDNILHILRLEYVWRLTYRHVPYHIDRRGLRVAVHLTF